ncbi:hypothetical protein [Pontibacter anaerobius]|uniref:PepSY domain-containing protein n=1 Tax=Pontibacter anaerobius TaxID=2993940 RepID=A0ABT3RAK8_9BACT|nr:hypothetical protein [Pontibacter anaerobius]MCX2738412.1 hypothetical protein [Pontibacter anaerobius]
MKKATFFAAAIAILGFTSLNAQAQEQAQTQGQQTEQVQEQGNRELVTQDQLPEAVQNALKSDVYKDWTVGEIHKITPEEGAANAEVVYEIKLTNAEGQEGVVRMNEKGGAAESEKE